ncbi:lipopolysaccharide biosynthesis [Novosphingobium nitrogenifigens DSM 19370]|uniref:Lipopolysaccharide biosynthesis n=1 Tax=Novosphingobium nitrogenifigens DSM 19370 TaxID=983920 RepID=F1Z926_9SPHN|nr:XrtA system polysaccharide chain length determinant [Novosphingobium nitrogenifigens]EGD58954.1 lipopolysaccharide biosynthesis [Novosphingobium nitrogenifigens DSM 19370]
MASLQDQLRIALFSIWNRRWLALGVAWLVCLGGWLMVTTIPNQYESHARIFVQLDDVLSDQIGIGADRHRDIDRVRQTLTSAVNLEKVVRATRLGEKVSTEKQMEGAVASLSKAVKVTSQQDNLFEIAATSGSGGYTDAQNAKLAQDIAQKMIDIFREENLAGGRGEMSDTLAFMDQQLADRQRDLEAAEQKRQQFEAKNPAAAQGAGTVSARLEATRGELRGVESDLIAAEGALGSINGQLASIPPTIAIPGTSGGAKGALAQAEVDLGAMRARGLTDSHPDVIALKAQIAQLTRAAASEGGHGGTPNPAYSSLQSIKADRQASVVALQARKASLEQDITQLTTQQYSEPAVAAEASRINRDYDVLKEQYDKLLRDREALRLRGQVENERDAIKFEVIDPPTSPRGPSAPNRPLLLMAVLAVGIAAGCGVAYAVGYLRGSFGTTAQLERAVGLPVLGSVTLALTHAGRVQQWRQVKWFGGGVAGLVLVLAVLLALEFMKRRLVA